MNEEIYIAEDEDGIRLTVKTFLESEGYAVSDFPNGDLLYDAFLDKQPDLVILDVMMPGSSGFEITKKIRDISSVPIIILTAKTATWITRRASTWAVMITSRSPSVPSP